MAVLTVKQCLQQKYGWKSTSCGITPTKLVRNPRESTLNFIRFLSNSTQRKGDQHLEFKFSPAVTKLMVFFMLCWKSKTALSVNSGPWRTVLPLQCSSKWKRLTRCLHPLRMENWPTRKTRGDTSTASLHSRFISPSQFSNSHSPKAHHLMQEEVKARGAAFPLLFMMKTRSEWSTVRLQQVCFFCNRIQTKCFCREHIMHIAYKPTPSSCFSGQGRKQKTPKKFTGEQPSISGTFGLKGMHLPLTKIIFFLFFFLNSLIFHNLMLLSHGIWNKEIKQTELFLCSAVLAVITADLRNSFLIYLIKFLEEPAYHCFYAMLCWFSIQKNCIMWLVQCALWFSIQKNCTVLCD